MAKQKTAGKKKGGIAALIIVLVVLIIVFAAYLYFGEGKSTYPLEYEELIWKYAGEHSLDPYLVAAVIRTESHFDAEAVSAAGAMGLMQVMPDTGNWISEKLGEEGFTSGDLFDPETNIRYGTWYLKFLSDKFDGNTDLMLAAYNAGHGRVGEWLEDEEYSEGGNLVNIPYKETDEYIKKVNKAYEKYKEIYEAE